MNGTSHKRSTSTDKILKFLFACVKGNQILNEQVSANAMQIAQLEEIVEEYQLKLDHLGHCNSELNTQKINLDMKLAEMEAKCERYEFDLKDLQMLKNSKVEIEKLQKRFKELEIDLQDKNELIEQLNQAKEYLVENNSRLLTHNIKIQLFVESMGLDLENLESNASVKEYEFLRNQFKESQAEINELKAKNKEAVFNANVLADKISSKERELNDLQAKFQELHTELDAFKERVFTDAASQWDENEVPETVEDRQNKQSQEDFIKQIQFNFSELQNENDELLNEVSELKEKLVGLEDLKRKYETLKHELEENEVQQKVVDGLESETKAELQTIQQNQDDFIKQIQFNFNELQNENDELLNEVSELKERLAGLEAIRNKYEALNQELEENKKQLSSVEQNNAKLKAKLKQYVKQKKQTEPEKGKFFEDVNSVKRSPNKMCS